ncbi:MAG: ABC transporter ATP-binding protein [Candidatus Micrarchaeaceae archaeon]
MTDYSVQVKKVEKLYRAGDITVKALDGISFSLRRGEFAAIVGPSGSGKSTLMNLLGTIDKPTSGEIYIDGIPTSKMNGDQLAQFRNQKLGFIFQAYNLIVGLDAEKNAELPLMINSVPEEERRQRAEKLLSSLGLAARLRQKPIQLSGGEQQRVAIARALINNPALVLADEPTGNLDTKAGDGVIRLLNSISKERKVTIIMVTHNLDIVKHCDRVIHIRDGKIEKQQVYK